MEDTIINKVAQSALVTLNLESFYPAGEVATFDVKDYLFMELILKEKEYRETLKSIDWSIYKNKNVAITCSADAIIPLWAYMLAVSYLEPFAKDIGFGTADEVFKILFLKNLQQIDPKEYEDKRVVIKGCGDKKIPENAFVEITKILRPVAKSIMYGEPCSTVPIYKRK
ncbi:MAG: DUF2480 family protein [Bacteroidota bacterium]|nr:DUF2480 family protein [Bacteroidota bacterium]